MITGIGIDIVNVKRMEKWYSNTGLLERYFHPQELVVIHSQKKSAVQSLAGRFAAKEAFGKALGTGLTDILLKDIMVTNNNNGKPEIQVFGSAKKALEKSGANKMHVSLSHERDNAIALIIMEKV